MRRSSRDKAAGLLPAGIIASVGGTSVGGTDDVAAVAAVARRARPLSACRCRLGRLGDDLSRNSATTGRASRQADSIVFNPHKWLGAQFDCSIQFVRDPDSLVRTLAIRPEFLKTHGRDGIVNYSEWTVPLGRRFRALKLWFLLRAHGLEGLRAMIRNHVAWSDRLAERLRAHARTSRSSREPMLSLFSFRHAPPAGADADAAQSRAGQCDQRRRPHLPDADPASTASVAIRFQAGQFETEARDVDMAFDVIIETAAAPA